MTETKQTRFERTAQFLWDISADLAFVSDTQSLLPAVSGKIVSFFQADRLAFVDVDEGREAFTMAYDHRVPDLETAAAIGADHLAQYLSATLRDRLRSAEIVAIDDINTDPGFHPVVDFWQTKAHLIVGCVDENSLRFVFSLQRCSPYRWPADEVDLCRELA